MTNLTYNQLIELAPKDQIFKIRVQSNPKGEGTEQELYAYIYEDKTLNTKLLHQACIDGIDYSWAHWWAGRYKGTFDLILLTEVNSQENLNTSKGFDPETLTFDGMEIKSGDTIIINNDEEYQVYDCVDVNTEHGVIHKDFEELSIIRPCNYHLMMQQDVYLPINILNVTNHYPKKSELEIAEGELFIIASELSEYLQAKYSYTESIDQLNKFYDIKNKVENLKSNNQ